MVDLVVNLKVDAMLLDMNIPPLVAQDIVMEILSIVVEVVCCGPVSAVAAGSGTDEMMDIQVRSGVPEVVLGRAVLVVTAVDWQVLACPTWFDARAWMVEGLGIEWEGGMAIVDYRHWFRQCRRHPNQLPCLFRFHLRTWNWLVETDFINS